MSGNYPTWNPIDNGGSLTLGNGNLQAGNTGTAHNACRATVKFPSTGKWYYEGEIAELGGACCIGVDNSGAANPALATSGTFYILVNSGGSVQKYNEGTVTTMSGMGTPAQGGFLQVAYDADADKLWLGLNNNWMGSGSSANGNPGAGTEASISSVSDPFPATNLYTSNVVANFGQRSFNYSAPTNFKPLCTALFPTPTIADGSDYFQTVLWSGTGVARSITTTGMSPDFVWYKPRNSSSYGHDLFDIVRGANKILNSNNALAEYTETQRLTSFNSDSFSVGTSVTTNGTSTNYVGWVWDAGSSTASNTDGSVTTSVRASTTSGFSIVSYTGNGTDNATFGHGLNAAPEFIIVKRRDSADDWFVYSLPTANNILNLNSTSGASGSSHFRTMSSSTFQLSGNADVNANGGTFVAYCISPVAGFSAVGSYTGNGSTSGPFIHTGMRPRWVLIKKSSSSSAVGWYIQDTARDPGNLTSKFLAANSSAAEVNAGDGIDILSNGFRLKATGTDINQSGQTFIYVAFAENPFSSNGGLAR